MFNPQMISICEKGPIGSEQESKSDLHNNTISLAV